MKEQENTSFPKREHYETFKEARIINSRTDKFKAYTGPYFHRIEQLVYKLLWFIKHVPVKDRPMEIVKLWQPGCCVVETDHTAFEAHISPRFMRVGEIGLYSYMMRACPDHRQFIWTVTRALTGVNVCKFGGKRGRRQLKVSINGTRMSGDMCTSLGNGWTNLSLMKFVVHKLGGTCDGRVEGDDGVFVVKGLQPGSHCFSRLGFKIKLQLRDTIMATSFCGNIFHPDVLVNITNAVKQIAKFGWTMSNLRFGGSDKLLGLLRAKALSMLTTNAGCPILQSFACWAERVSRGAKLLFSGVGGSRTWWEAQCVLDPEIKPVDVRSRLLYEATFGITVKQQIELETYFDGQRTLHPVPITVIGRYLPQSWLDAWSDTMLVPHMDLMTQRRRRWMK